MASDIKPITFTLSMTYSWDEDYRAELERDPGDDWIVDDFYILMAERFDKYVASAVESDNVRIWANNNIGENIL